MGAGVAAVIIRKEKDLVMHFRSAGATNASAAKSAVALGVEQRLAWHILVRKNIIREAAPGTFYLDEQLWEETRKRRRAIAMFMIAALAAFSAALAAGVFKTLLP